MIATYLTSTILTSISSSISGDSGFTPIIPNAEILQNVIEDTDDATTKTSVTVTFTAPAEGNIIYLGFAYDKVVGALTPPSGYTLVDARASGTSMNCAVYFKVSDGTETAATLAWANNVSKPSARMLELSSSEASPLGFETFTSADSNNVTVNSQSTGTTSSIEAGDYFSVALAGWDSSNAISNVTWDNGFTLLSNNSAIFGVTYHSIGTAESEESSSFTLETTATGSGGDQAVAIMTVFNGFVPPSLAVLNIMSGGIGALTATVNGAMASASTDLRLQYSEDATFTTGVKTTASQVTTSPDDTFSFNLAGLAKNTQYFCRVVESGKVSANGDASFGTLAQNEALTYSFAMSGDAEIPDSSVAYANIIARDPDFVLSMGDTPYIDDQTVSGIPQRADYQTWLNTSVVKNMMSKIPYVYMWDDHDYGNNDSDGSNPAKSAQQATYREFFPSYSLPATNQSIYHAYTVGRVRFIILDTRSERSGIEYLDSTQESWLESEIDAAAADSTIKAIGIMSSVPWISSSGSDTWFGASAQRVRIADFIQDAGMGDNTFFMCADAHMIAADDGSNSQYDTGGLNNTPVFQSAPLNRSNSVKGGPYTEGTFSASNAQYSIITVTDSGGSTINISCTGYDGTDSSLYTLAFNTV